MQTDNPVYNEAYYQGGDEAATDETFILLSDGAGCLTPELVYVPATPWDGVGSYYAPSAEILDPFVGVAD